MINKMNIVENKKVLITGGTGTFGKAFTRKLLEWGAKKIYIFSRDELKQSEMKKDFENNERLAFFIGDIRDKERLYRAFDGINYVIHAAAQKHVPSCEYNPFEAIKTNVLGAQNVIEAAIDNNVEKVIALSTDKAVYPSNLYGMTKGCMEKLFISGNAYAGGKKTIFSCIRYGNVIGSRGSIIPFFKKLKEENKKIPLTDIFMTRFWIKVDRAINLVMMALQYSKGGEIYIPKIPSMKIIDLIRAMDADDIEITGIRPGEKLHETLISEEESQNTETLTNYFIIHPNFEWLDTDKFKNDKKFSYNSLHNDDWILVEEMRKILNEK
jgi:UDP-N-acetylglucosamine 4,6-dehydratase/5-epimerase